MESDSAFHDQLERLKSGEDAAATAIFERYVNRLLALAQSRLSAKLKRRIDPEDIVHSAFRSFFVDAQAGAFQLEHSGDLWRLLAAITLNKLHRVVEKQTAAKRTIHRDEPNSHALVECLSAEPTAADVVAATEQFSLALKDLSADEQFAFASSLQGASVEQIAASRQKSPRTVRRSLATARAKIEQRLLAPPQSATLKTRDELSASSSQAHLRYADYTLVQLIGAGGMGKVYRAKETATGRTVAIKSLHKARQTDRRAVAQFLQEAQVLAQLRHPNIVGVHGLGRFPAGGFFIVMDYLEGVDLQRKIDCEPVPAGRAVAIVAQVASAVEHAHENGILHCDLKPGNVILGQDEHVTVTDFGFSYLIADRAQAGGNAIGGTVGYLAPEVLFAGQRPTIATDIYGLGALLWALCTGKPPAASPPTSDPRVPNSIATICTRCLTNQPQRRYPSVTALIHELNELPASNL